MDTFRALGLFVRVVELGSFTAAAREAGVGQPTLSKAISALERSLGVRLLERTTTGLTPTEEGRRFYARGKQLVEDYRDAAAEVRGTTDQLKGTLRVNAPLGLGELRLNNLVLSFLADHPGIELELILNDRMVDLVEEGVDVAIRLGYPLPQDAVAREIAYAPRVLAASPAYLRTKPKLEVPEDLAAHEYIWFAGLSSRNVLTFNRGTEVATVAASGRFRVNSSLSLRQSLLQGAGLGSAPTWLVQDLIEAGDLTHLLADWCLPGQSLHLIYPSRRYLPLRTRAFMRFMTEHLTDLPGFRAPASGSRAQ